MKAFTVLHTNYVVFFNYEISTLAMPIFTKAYRGVTPHVRILI